MVHDHLLSVRNLPSINIAYPYLVHLVVIVVIPLIVTTVSAYCSVMPIIKRALVLRYCIECIDRLFLLLGHYEL
jgi:hypothetical protein